MRRAAILLSILLAVGLLIAIGSGCTQTAAPSGAAQTEIALPSPTLSGTVSVEEALAKRRSVRSFAAKELTLAQVGQLAWAAQGITDPASGKRTAPSAMAVYPLTVYLVKSDGAFRYMPAGHKLMKLSGSDVRAALSGQAAVRRAALNFVIVGDMTKARAKFGERAERWVAIEAGHVAQNIHLQAVALGLGSVSVGGYTDADVVKALELPTGEMPFYIIPVGYRAD